MGERSVGSAWTHFGMRVRVLRVRCSACVTVSTGCSQPE